MKELQRQDMEKGFRVSMPSPGVPLFPDLHVFTIREALWMLSWFFTEASLHRHDWLSHWPLVNELNLQPLSSPEMGGGRWYWKFQPSDHKNDFPGNQLPILKLPKGFPLLLLSQEILGVLRALSRKPWTKTKYIFFINHSIIVYMINN